MSKEPFQHAVMFCILFVATQFVNKYVLSVLKFQFPTIFQGWQTLIGFLMLSLLVTTRHLPTLMEHVSRNEIASWLPGMVFFVGSIYSGSKALSKLSVPVYLSLHNLITVMLSTGQLAIYRQLTSLYSYMMIMLLVISSIFIGLTDPDFHADGYFWMCIHIITSGTYGIFNRFTRTRLKLSSYEKLYCNYLYSMIMLAPSSYFLGDAVEAGKYPYLYFSKFYMGCLMSGIFGVFLALSNIKLMELNLDRARFSKIASVSKLITSTLSLLFFNMTPTATNIFWLIVNHLAAIVCEDSSNVEETPMISTSSLPSNTQQLTQQNDITREYIKVNVF